MDDCNLDWTFRKDFFGFIHARRMAGSISDQAKFAKQALEALKPGGYFECHEMSMRFESDDGTVKKGSCMEKCGELWKDAGIKLGRSFTIVEDGTLETSMIAAGFTDIKDDNYKVSP